MAGLLRAVLDRDQLERVDGQELAQSRVQAGKHARLVQGRGHRPGDAVQRLEATRLVSGQLVEGGVGEKDAKPAVDVFQELDLRGRHPPLAECVIDDAPDDLALVKDRDPDHELAPDPRARAGAGLLLRRLDRENCRLRVGKLARKGRLADRTAAHVLQHAGVHRQGVVPALPLEHLQVDGVVAEPRLEAPIEDLDQVGFGDAASQLVDQSAR